MMYLLVAIIFGVVSATVAQSKGRNTAAWFAAGLLIVVAPVASRNWLVASMASSISTTT